MNVDFTYLIVSGLLLLVAIFYLSPYELSVREEEEED